MPTSIQVFRDPFAIGEVAISAGGANEITIVQFPGAPADLIVTIIPANDMEITTVGVEGATIASPKFQIFSGGLNEIPGTGWGRENGIGQIRIASSVQGANAQIMVARK